MGVIMKIKVILLFSLSFFGFYTSQVYSYFYGAITMKNPTTGKVVVLLPDMHQPSEITKEHQNEVVSLVKHLKQKQSVHVLVEDLVSFAPSMPNGFSESPLVLLEELCKQNAINCTNVEFRDYWDQTRIDVIKEYMKNVETSIGLTAMEKLHSYYVHWQQLEYFNDYPFLDSSILHNIKANNASSIVLVCAGGIHTASVAKMLYQQGYNNVRIKISEGPISECMKSFMYDYDKDEPLAGVSTHEEEALFLSVQPLLNIKEIVLEDLRSLEMKV